MTKISPYYFIDCEIERALTLFEDGKRYGYNWVYPNRNEIPNSIKQIWDIFNSEISKAERKALEQHKK